MKIYGSEEILADPTGIQELDEIKYRMTAGEVGWLSFIRGRYSIADYLFSVFEEEEDGSVILTIDYWDMSKALSEDTGTSGKAVMLSDDTALQAIFFYNFIEHQGGHES